MSEKLQENVRKAAGFLRRFRDEVTPHFIDGKPHRRSSGSTFENLTPVDNTSLGRVAEGTTEDVDDAARAASAAFPGWRDLPGKDRQRLLNRFADLIIDRAEEIALVESMDTGQPIRFMKAAALRGAENFRFFADKAPEARNGLSLFQEEHVNYDASSHRSCRVITPGTRPSCFRLEDRAAPPPAAPWSTSPRS
jgi:5-carboxymethyl-2-hydroxymuconic-semialdehyde dehydrogenase